jgi:hypothetical protein
MLRGGWLQERRLLTSEHRSRLTGKRIDPSKQGARRRRQVQRVLDDGNPHVQDAPCAGQATPGVDESRRRHTQRLVIVGERDRKRAYSFRLQSFAAPPLIRSP